MFFISLLLMTSMCPCSVWQRCEGSDRAAPGGGTHAPWQEHCHLWGKTNQGSPSRPNVICHCLKATFLMQCAIYFINCMSYMSKTMPSIYLLEKIYLFIYLNMCKTCQSCLLCDSNCYKMQVNKIFNKCKFPLYVLTKFSFFKTAYCKYFLENHSA